MFLKNKERGEKVGNGINVWSNQYCIYPLSEVLCGSDTLTKDIVHSLFAQTQDIAKFVQVFKWSSFDNLFGTFFTDVDNSH